MARLVDGVPERAHLEMLAARGNREAIASLDGPECPEGFQYLHRWALSLHGRSGVGPGGLTMLRPSELKAWADLMGLSPSPEEVEALFTLDAVMLHPEAE